VVGDVRQGLEHGLRSYPDGIETPPRAFQPVRAAESARTDERNEWLPK
jgi:hypothetical protein